MLNISNLVDTNENEQNESMDNALTVSQTYDLLNENVNVSWNDSIIKLRSPYALNSISSISFRSFIGEFLPYTTLELPNLEFGIKVIVSKNFNFPIYILGETNNFIKSFINIMNQFSNSTENIIYQDNKIFTYDSSSEFQINYNIEEIINFLNEVFKNWVLSYGIKYFLGGDYNFNLLDYSEFFTYSPFRYSVGKLSFLNNGIVRIPYFDSSNNINYNVLDISDYISGYTSTFCSTSLNSNLRLFHLDKGDNLQFVTLVFYSDTLITRLSSYYTDCELWTNEIKTCSHAFVKTANNEYLIIMPDFDNPSIRIIKNENSYNISSGYEDYNYYLILGATYESDMRIFITFLGYNNYAEVYFEQGYISLSSGYSYTSNHERRLITEEEYNYYKACHVSNLSMGLTWNNPHSSIYTHEMNLCNTFRTIIDERNSKCKILFCEFLDDSNDETYFITNKTPFNISHERVIRKTSKTQMNTETELYNAYTFGIWNYLHLGETIKLDNSSNSVLKIISTNSDFIPSFYLDGKVINYTSTKYLNNFSSYYVKDENKTFPANLLNDSMTIENEEYFSINTETGIFNYPIIYFDETNYISFIPFIKTNPFYFNVEFKPGDLQTKAFSMFTNEGNIKLIEINKHIFDTIESLILLKYETNDLRFRCMNFPNNDNIVFSMNEVANVNFKSFNINGTGIELICSIIDNENNNIDKETLKRLYGKLVVNIDFKN